MHVAVEHFESSLGHAAIPLPMLTQFFITPSVRTSLEERYVPMLADPAIDTSDACPLIVLNSKLKKSPPKQPFARAPRPLLRRAKPYNSEIFIKAVTKLTTLPVKR